MPGKQKDNGTMIGKMLPGMIGPGTTPKSPMQPRAKARKERRAKEKASLASMMAKMEKEAPKMEQPILRILPKAAPPLLPQ